VDGDGSIGLAVFSAGIAAVAAGIAVWRSVLAGRQAREARKSRELNAVIALFEAHQSEDAGHLRRLLRNHAIADHLDDPELRIHLRAYVNHLNFIATLRARGLLGEELVRDLFYEAARTCWEQTAKPFIRDIRATQNEDFARELQNWINAPDP
jgi:hypothetical protein